MGRYRFNGHTVNRLPRACSACGRNDHKVVVRRADGLLEGFCPSCWADDSRFGRRAALAGSGATIERDLRARRAEWDELRRATLRDLDEAIAGMERLVAEDPFADAELLEKQRAMRRLLLAEIVPVTGAG